jgi:hypothetical protein
MKLKSPQHIIITSLFLSLLIVAGSCSPKIESMGKESLLEIRESGENSLRITLRPKDVNFSLLQTPLLSTRGYGRPAMKISSTTKDGNRKCRFIYR